MAAEKPKLDARSLQDMARLAGIELDEARAELLLPLVERTMENISRFDELGLLDKEPANVFQFSKDE